MEDKVMARPGLSGAGFLWVYAFESNISDPISNYFKNFQKK